MSSCSPSNPAAGPEPAATGGSGTRGCTACTITSQTVATSPVDRARTRIGVGEEVTLTVNPGPATWAITSGTGSLNPSRGSHTAVTYTANDTAGSVTITATGSGCTCTITFTVVAPSSWTMIRKPGTNLKHTNGRPDCGWLGIMYIHPNDVNFYNVETRELNSQFSGSGSYSSFTGAWHQPASQSASGWFPTPTNLHGANGSQVAMNDNIYSGDPGSAATGTAPPFTTGTGHFPITWQWRVGTGSAHNFPVSRHESEIFANGRCEMRKGGNTEHTMYNDPPSTY